MEEVNPFRLPSSAALSAIWTKVMSTVIWSTQIIVPTKLIGTAKVLQTEGETFDAIPRAVPKGYRLVQCPLELHRQP